ncbi:MAG TPA: hypothetical protein VFX04_05380 [Rhodanobacteraceae bacterium]|jgi:hypothetical protein|nr:hypothetical protein [Rhodanobacteraceae bacterium]
MQCIQHPHRHCRIHCALIALLALATLPTAATAACTTKDGGVSPMQAYAGNYLNDKNLLAAPAVAARLKSLPVPVRQHFERNLDVAGQIDLVGCHLVVAGNAQHKGGEENAIVDVNLYSGAVTFAIHSRGRTDIWLDQDPTALTSPPYAAVPGAVKQWAVLADLGFPYQKPASVQVHPPQR